MLIITSPTLAISFLLMCMNFNNTCGGPITTAQLCKVYFALIPLLLYILLEHNDVTFGYMPSQIRLTSSVVYHRL